MRFGVWAPLGVLLLATAVSCMPEKEAEQRGKRGDVDIEPPPPNDISFLDPPAEQYQDEPHPVPYSGLPTQYQDEPQPEPYKGIPTQYKDEPQPVPYRGLPTQYQDEPQPEPYTDKSFLFLPVNKRENSKSDNERHEPNLSFLNMPPDTIIVPHQKRFQDEGEGDPVVPEPYKAGPKAAFADANPTATDGGDIVLFQDDGETVEPVKPVLYKQLKPVFKRAKPTASDGTPIVAYKDADIPTPQLYNGLPFQTLEEPDYPTPKLFNGLPYGVGEDEPASFQDDGEPVEPVKPVLYKQLKPVFKRAKPTASDGTPIIAYTDTDIPTPQLYNGLPFQTLEEPDHPTPKLFNGLPYGVGEDAQRAIPEQFKELLRKRRIARRAPPKEMTEGMKKRFTHLHARKVAN